MIHEYKDVNDDSELQFRITTFKEIWEKLGGKPDIPHRHDYYTVILAEDAEGSHVIDFVGYELKPKTLFFVSPGQVHQVLNSREGIGYVLLFSTEFLIRSGIELSFLNELHLFNDYGETPPILLNSEELTKLNTYAEEMHFLAQSSMKFKEEAAGALLKLFLLYVNSWNADRLQKDTQNRESIILRKFRTLVEQNFSTWHNTSSYAQELGISSDHLNRTIKRLIGKTAKEFVLSRIAVEAKRLLTFTELSTKEICYELGFSEPGNFSAFFKKQTHMSPSQFKKTLNIGNS